MGKNLSGQRGVPVSTKVRCDSAVPKLNECDVDKIVQDSFDAMVRELCEVHSFRAAGRTLGRLLGCSDKTGARYLQRETQVSARMFVAVAVWFAQKRSTEDLIQLMSRGLDADALVQRLSRRGRDV